MSVADPNLLRRVVLRMVLADGRVVPSEITRVRWVLEHALGDDPGTVRLRAELEELSRSPATVAEVVTEHRDQLDDASRRRLLRAAYFIATADGTVADAEDALLVELARALEISPERYRAMLHQLSIAREVDPAR